MEDRTKHHIVILLTNSFAILNMVHSGLIVHLAKQYHVLIWSDLISADILRHITSCYNISISRVNAEMPIESRLLRFARRFQKAVFFEMHQIDSHKIKLRSQSTFVRIAWKIFRLILISGRNMRTVFESASTVIDWLLTRQQCKNPVWSSVNGVISTSPLDIRENIAVRLLQKKGVKSMGIIISWDNLTTKGVINVRFDEILVWNDLMKNELQKYALRNVAPKISVVGNPRFDTHFKSVDPQKDDFRKRFSINEDDHIILFATSPSKHFPNQIFVANDLLDYVRNRKHTILLIRCHPYDYADYALLGRSDKLIICRPPAIFNEKITGGVWLPQLDFLDELSEALSQCATCVQVASTVMIDALASEKPVLSIAYDGPEILPFQQSVRRFYEYDHQKAISNLNLDRKIYAVADLHENLDDIIIRQNPRTPALERIRPITTFVSAQSTGATLKSIREWLG